MGNQREKPETTKETTFVKLNKFKYASTSMCGWRCFMEDAQLSICPFNNDENMALFAIFDGHGGVQCAQFAKNHFASCLLQNEYFKSREYELALNQACLNIDYLMRKKSGQAEIKMIRDQNVKKQNTVDYQGDTVSGCTANICLITKNEIFVANIGDSRAIGITRNSQHNKAKIKELSTDHKPGNEEEKKRIIKAGGKINQEGRINDNLNMSRAIGDFAYKNNYSLKADEQIIIAYPEIRKCQRKQIEYILMGCDGVWERKSNIEMAKWVLRKRQKGNNLQIIVQDLLNQQLGKTAEGQFGMDNMTAILIHIC